MMSLLGSLVAGVAHEVRNPLFGISSILDAFETRFSDRTEYLRYTNVLRDEIGRLTILMEELLEYGKPFRGDLYLVSMEEMVARSIRACLPAAEVAQVNLESKVEDSLPKIRIDRRRLSKVFRKLDRKRDSAFTTETSSVSDRSAAGSGRQSRVGPVCDQRLRRRHPGGRSTKDLRTFLLETTRWHRSRTGNRATHHAGTRRKIDRRQ